MAFADSWIVDMTFPKWHLLIAGYGISEMAFADSWIRNLITLPKLIVTRISAVFS